MLTYILSPFQYHSAINKLYRSRITIQPIRWPLELSSANQVALCHVYKENVSSKQNMEDFMWPSLQLNPISIPVFHTYHISRPKKYNTCIYVILKFFLKRTLFTDASQRRGTCPVHSNFSALLMGPDTERKQTKPG